MPITEYAQHSSFKSIEAFCIFLYFASHNITLHHIIDLTLMLFKLIRVPIWLSVRRSINMHESRDLEFTHKNETKLFRQLWNPIWQLAIGKVQRTFYILLQKIKFLKIEDFM